MQKEDIHILIVDDDASLGKAIAQTLSRAGYKATHVLKPDEALSFVKFHTIHVAVIDCMLPKMNGRDLAKKLKQDVPTQLTIILMSGIYKDKAFTREAIQSTGAVAFLSKPFEIKDFLNEIDNHTKRLIDPPLVKLQQFLSMNELSPKERMAAVDEADTVHAFDLPWIFSLLMHPHVSGHLNIISADGDVSGVGFSNGEIVQVYQEDLKSYFGVLMVENGFISQADLDEVMKNPSQSKKLGERLVEANALSPHAIEVVMTEQQGLRLSKTVNDTSVKVNFIEAADMRVNAHTDKSALAELLNEWLTSKITLAWLKSAYVPWLRHNVRKGPEWSAHHRVMSTPVVQRAPQIARALLESETLEAAQNHGAGLTDDQFYRALHALIITRALRFGEATSNADYGAQLTRLKKLHQTLETQSHFERLGVSQKAKDSEIRRAYHELAKVLHPDKLSQDAPSEVRDLAKKTFDKISTAYSTLSDTKLRDRYLLELEKGRAEAQLEAENLSELARPLLSKGDVKKALELLEQAEKLAPMSSETRTLLLWAKLKSPGAERDSRLHQSIKEQLAAIPPEDRHSANFFFVRGLLMRVTGDLESAKRNFEHVLSQNGDFIEARRELNYIHQSTTPQKTNILNGDLKDVVGMFFKKKKSS